MALHERCISTKRKGSHVCSLTRNLKKVAEARCGDMTVYYIETQQSRIEPLIKADWRHSSQQSQTTSSILKNKNLPLNDSRVLLIFSMLIGICGVWLMVCNHYGDLVHLHITPRSSAVSPQWPENIPSRFHCPKPVGIGPLFKVQSLFSV